MARQVAPAIPLEEPLEETARRVLGVATAELNAAFARGDVDATAFDGSVASGRFWPSSDVDVTVVPAHGDKWRVDWTVRDGLVVHTHVSPWKVLDDLRAGYPQSFVQTAAGRWIRDPTWLLDGLASMQPVHDPHGRLLDLKQFMRAHRFRPEVTEPRRPLLLDRAARLTKEAADAVSAADATDSATAADAGDTIQAADVSGNAQAERHTELAAEALELIWLEASEQIISRKELDPALARACTALGAPHAHSLIRQAHGVDQVEAHAAPIADAFRALVIPYSAWLEPLLPRYPSGEDEQDWKLAYSVYLRHEFWSGLYAPLRGCLLHLASIIPAVRELSTTDLQDFATCWLDTDAGTTTHDPRLYHEIEDARAQILAVTPFTPWPSRLAALHELYDLTHHTFGS